MDQVTQWEIVAATERISEAWLEPVLCALMRQLQQAKRQLFAPLRRSANGPWK